MAFLGRHFWFPIAAPTLRKGRTSQHFPGHYRLDAEQQVTAEVFSMARRHRKEQPFPFLWPAGTQEDRRAIAVPDATN